MKHLHLLIGTTGFIAFLATGFYMKAGFPELYGDNEVAHAMYRANHIYLGLSALLNLTLGLYIQRHSQIVALHIQRLGSVLLLLATPVFLIAFINDTAEGLFERQSTFFAYLFSVVGAGLHILSKLLERQLARL